MENLMSPRWFSQQDIKLQKDKPKCCPNKCSKKSDAVKRRSFHGTFLTPCFLWILSLTHSASVSSCPLSFFPPSPVPHSPSSRLLRWFRALSCCEGEAGWWGEREWPRERPSLSPRCSSHLPALPWWVVCVLVCQPAGFSGKTLCGTFLALIFFNVVFPLFLTHLHAQVKD